MGKVAAIRGNRSIRWLCLALIALGAADMGRAAYMPAKATLAQMLLSRAFADSLASGVPERPWPWADTEPVARLTFERLHTQQIVLAGGTGQALAFGPAHLPGTALPGHDGTTVISAHRDSHFAMLKNVRLGDSIWVEGIDGTKALYRIEQTAVVEADNFGLDRDGPSQLILTTCYPFGARTETPWRYIVVAVREAP